MTAHFKALVSLLMFCPSVCLSVCLLLLQHRKVIEELKHEREGFQEVLQAKDKELKVTKVLILVEKNHVYFAHAFISGIT